ncbi:MAG: hypothetical protein AUG51_17070 [Acidobacteria bacterium 13_1_20CM_3_53_8]|nr:MAG: hypothetical protein AUG51_17070 [Acidobacteria bacterium 13_1_20CM_3_53_8]
MTTAQKEGFGGQWIEIFIAGKHTDSKGKEHNLPVAFLESVVNNFDSELHEPPAVIGHPQDDSPAFGYVTGLRLKGDRLEAKFCDTDPQFEEMVRGGKFKKRSAAFYLDEKIAPAGRAPSLRHVGFLGAAPPSVKGLRNIHFNEGEAVTFEIANFSEGDSMDEKEIKKSITEGIKDYFKNLFSPKEDASQTAAFSEAEFSERVTKIIEQATKPLTDQIAALKDSNTKLEQKVAAQSDVTTRSELTAFCEKLGTAKFPPAFKQMGVVEFMETLAEMPSDKKVVTISFAEKDGKKSEVKTETAPLAWFKDFLTKLGPFIEFGEQFGSLRATGDNSEIVDPERMSKLRDDMGIKPKEAK